MDQSEANSTTLRHVRAERAASLADFRRELLSDPALVVDWVDDLLTPTEVISEFPHLARSVQVLAKLRSQGRGPAFFKPPGRSTRVLYRRTAILAYIERNTVRTKDDPVGAAR